MSDLDDELLALAGGDISSEDEGENMSRDGSRSPAPATSKSSGATKGMTQRKPPARKARKRSHGDDSEEEGEA